MAQRKNSLNRKKAFHTFDELSAYAAAGYAIVFGICFTFLLGVFDRSKNFFAFLFCMLSLFYGLLAVTRFFKAIQSHSARPSTKRSAPDAEQKPPLPVQAKAPEYERQVPEPYRKRLVILKKQIEQAEESEKAIDRLIQDSFGSSWMSASRYKSVLDGARDVLEKNYENASQAVEVFGSADVTEKRIRFLDNYVADSADLLNRINGVIDKLLELRQSQTLKDGDDLDERLDELSRTTMLYSNQPARMPSGQNK